jgi:hypothetical protein
MKIETLPVPTPSYSRTWYLFLWAATHEKKRLYNQNETYLAQDTPHDGPREPAVDTNDRDVFTSS